MADVLFQNLPSQSVVLPSHEILLDNGSVTGRATISKVIELFNNSGSINKLTSSGSIDIKSNTDLFGGGDINFYNGNTLISKYKSNANGTAGIYEIVETNVSSSFISASANSVGLGSKDNQLYRIDEVGKTGQILCADDWGETKGGYVFDGTNDYVSILAQNYVSLSLTHTIIIDFVTGNNVTSEGTIFSSYINNNDRMAVQYKDGSLRVGYFNGSVETKKSITIAANTRYQLVIIFSITDLVVYLNGISAVGTLGVAHFPTTIPTIIGAQNSEYYGTGYYGSFTIFSARLFNRALSQSEVIALYNNGLTCQNALPIADYYANQTALTSGTLIIGKRYKIDTYVTGDDFTNVATVESGTINTSGCIFICKATTPTTWTNSSSLRQIGCVAEYLPENAGRIGWIETQNGLHGQTSGSPICKTAEERPYDYHDVKTLVTGNTTLTSVIPKGYMLKTIIIENTTANAFTLNVGSSTSGGTDVVNGAVISASGLTTITINKTFSMSADQTLYLQSANWNSSSSNIYLTMERI